MPLILAQSFGQLHREAKALGRGKAGSREGSPKSPAELGRGNPPWAQSACPPWQEVCQLGQLLPQFPSWYDPPRSAAAAGAQGLSKQFSSKENFHPPFLFFDQVDRIRRRDPPGLPSSLPIPRHSQLVGAALGCCLLHCLWRGAFTTTPILCGSQCWRTRAEYPRAPVDQGSSLSPPHPVLALTPGAGQAAASFREGCAGMGRGWAGLGETLHTTITLGVQGAPSQAVLTSLPPCTKQSSPNGSRLCQVCPVHTTQRLAQPIHSWTAPSMSPHLAQGPQGALGRARSREPSTHPSCLSLAALQPGAESNTSRAG